MSVVDDLLQSLAGCLCEQIRAAGLPEPCFCGVLPGSLVAVDYVGMCEERDGMAWARLAMAYPASGVGVPNQSMRNCSGGLGIEIELGAMRSAPTLTDDGEPPTEAQQLAVSQVQNGDMLAMMQAVACCAPLQNYDWIMSSYSPQGPTGFAVGGTFTVMVAL